MRMGYEPLKLEGERVWRTYTGGRGIDLLHHAAAPGDGHFPEEWMYSMTRASNAGRENVTEGICHLYGEPQITLKDLILRQPEEMLGRARTARWGNTLGILVKIIDSKERLTVQVHPDQKTAARLFHSPFGKTECWHILEVREEEENPCLYLGFRPGISRRAWEECFHRQDYPQMLRWMNRVLVKPGETYLVRGGLPHAIGAGCMLVEIQEPTDYTIRVERVTPSGFSIDDRMCHQGLGFEAMFDCFDYTGRSQEEIRLECCIPPKTKGSNVQELVGYEETSCFRMERMEIETCAALRGEGEFVCLYVVQGSGRLHTASSCFSLEAGSQFFIPAACGEYEIEAGKAERIQLLKLYGPKC